MTQAPQPPAAGAPVANPGKGLGIAGMVLGIVACALFCVWYLAIPCAVVGLILSIIARGKSKAANAPTSMATAGMVLSIIALVLDVVLGLLLWSLIAGFVGMGKSMQDELRRNMEDANRTSSLIDWVRMLL